MKRAVLFSTMALIAGSLLAADSAKDDVKTAAGKLAGNSFSWRTTVDSGPGGGGGGARFRPGPTEGKADKEGTLMLSMTRGDNTTEAVLKGGKGAIKTQDGWKSLSEAGEDDGGGQPNPGRFLARMLQNFKAPPAEARNLLSKTKELKKSDDTYSGDLTEEGAKEFLTPFRRPGGDGPEVSDAKGAVKFWLNNGVLSKYEYKVEGKVSFNGNERDVKRTTTVEIKDVGSTTLTIPDEAKKKLS